MGFFGVAFLVALRVLIGVQFLTAGIDKLDPSFSSAGFLRSASGPLAGFYQSQAPLPHQWDQYLLSPLPPGESFESERVYLDRDKKTKAWIVGKKRTKIDRVGHIPFPTDAYGPWAGQVASDWYEVVKQFQGLPGISDEQQQASEAEFNNAYYRLARFMEEHRGDLADYHHEASRLSEMKREAANGSPPFAKERIKAKKAQVEAIPRPWVAEVAALEEGFYESLAALPTDEQTELAAQASGVLYPATTLHRIDNLVKWLTLIVGVCLIVGFCTRLAAVAGAAFLVSIISTQPPWVEGIAANVKLIVGYQGIEVLALLLLAAIGAGAWAGLDGLIWGRKVES